MDYVQFLCLIYRYKKIWKAFIYKLTRNISFWTLVKCIFFRNLGFHKLFIVYFSFKQPYSICERAHYLLTWLIRLGSSNFYTKRRVFYHIMHISPFKIIICQTNRWLEHPYPTAATVMDINKKLHVTNKEIRIYK